MDLGFETIGNATVICHDNGPVLATDPWLRGSAYFGSWQLTHEVPTQQLEAIQACQYLWLSHGHPDHLSPESLELLRGKPILIGDHYGGRIAAGLREDGFEVRILKTGEWTPLTDRIKILCVPDYQQDSVLLIDMDGKLVIDSNDASDRGVGDLLRETIAAYEKSFLLCLTGYGDADMINFFDEAGKRIPPLAAEKHPVGPGIAEILRYYGIKNFVPSSSMHKYQRADSVWANEYRTPENEHGKGFESEDGTVFPAFIRYDLARDDYTRIDPKPEPDLALAPEEFGDNWSDQLDDDDRSMLERYFRRVEHLKNFLGYVNFRVGGQDNFIDIERERFDRGVTFEVPRASLMTSIRYEVFDDVLIGNFMKTTLNGQWERQGAEGLYPDFTPFVTKYGDNGGARTAEELRAYFAFYKNKGFFGPGPSAATQQAMDSIQAYL